MQPEQAWLTAHSRLQMEMSKASFDTYLREAEFLGYDDGCFQIGVRKTMVRDWLEGRLTDTMARLLTGMMNCPVRVSFVIIQVASPTEEEDERAEPQGDLQIGGGLGVGLRPRYTFDTFVVGPSNRMAHAASRAVADRPALAYNPLFLYGGVGLGKTHLLYAIGNQCAQQGLNVLYVTGEDFTNDLISAIRTQSTPAFREKYRRTDVLLVDDIQFLANKEAMQEEFFHTFNTLHGQEKQLVMTSDRHPKAMMTLEERLRSRFEWGLTVDIQPPDIETRMAILRAKAERNRKQVPAELFELIARRVPSNIRDLEGALTKVVAYADLSGQELNVRLAEVALADILPLRGKLQADDVIRIVAEVFGVSVENLLGRDRSRCIALPRQIAMYLLREEASFSLPQIGEVLGGRDHTTVIHGCEKIQGLLARDDQLRRQVMLVKERLYPSRGVGGQFAQA